MTKRVCDICGNDAVDLETTNHREPWGNSGTSSLTVRISVSFTNRPDGYSGTPDLCQSCALYLMSRAAKAFEVRCNTNKA